MGLEPTTFCMAKGTGDLTTMDATDGIPGQTLTGGRVAHEPAERGDFVLAFEQADQDPTRPSTGGSCAPQTNRSDAAIPDEDALRHDTAASATSSGSAASCGARFLTMCRATRSASRPVPAMSIDANEWRNGRPAK